MIGKSIVVCSVPTGGGVSEAFLSSLWMLKHSGVRPVAVVPSNINYASRLRALDVEIIRIDSLDRGGLLNVIRHAFMIARLARKAKANCFILHNGRLVRPIQTFARDIPLLAICHGGKIKRYLKSDRVVTVNATLRAQLLEAGYSGSKCAVVGNALPFDPPSSFAPRNPSAKVFTIGSLMLLESSKGLDILIDTIQILVNQGRAIHARIGGTGSEEAWLRRRLDELGLNDRIELTGWIDDKQAFLSSLDAYVQPSKHETFGIAILEAFAHSVPVILNRWLRSGAEAVASAARSRGTINGNRASFALRRA